MTGRGIEKRGREGLLTPWIGLWGTFKGELAAGAIEDSSGKPHPSLFWCSSGWGRGICLQVTRQGLKIIHLLKVDKDPSRRTPTTCLLQSLASLSLPLPLLSEVSCQPVSLSQEVVYICPSSLAPDPPEGLPSSLSSHLLHSPSPTTSPCRLWPHPSQALVDSQADSLHLRIKKTSGSGLPLPTCSVP